MEKNKYDVSGVSLDKIRNANELKVIRMMRELVTTVAGFDNCPLCIQDVYALSLSQLIPKYIQTGTIVLKRSDDEAAIRKAVRHAILQVIEHPNHS